MEEILNSEELTQEFMGCISAMVVKVVEDEYQRIIAAIVERIMEEKNNLSDNNIYSLNELLVSSKNTVIKILHSMRFSLEKNQKVSNSVH